ncbi:MAG TPA: alpha/beta hydrolase [Chryseolinea sp.]
MPGMFQPFTAARCVLIAFIFTIASLGHCQTPVDSSGTILVGGIKQFVSIKGRDNRNPLLLFLHGGPGNSVISYAEKFTQKLQEHFVVVQWDQRNAGKTLSINKSTRPLAVTLFKNDTHQIIDSLLTRFRQSKLYLAGHSWGTVLGFYMAKNFPEKLHAYISICPMINQLESERTALQLMEERASEAGNDKALQELSQVKVPFENGKQLYIHRKWVLSYMGSKAKITEKQVEDWSQSWLQIFNEASRENLFESAASIRCPVYLFIGRKDVQTNSKLAEKYFHILEAPQKELYWFELSGHSLPTTEPELLQTRIIALKHK